MPLTQVFVSISDPCSQGCRSYAFVVDVLNMSFTIMHLRNPCSQRPVLCSFLAFWRSHGNGKAGVDGRSVQRA